MKTETDEERQARLEMARKTVIVLAVNAFIDSRMFAITNDDFLRKVQAIGVYDALMHVSFLLGVQGNIQAEIANYLINKPNEALPKQ